MEAEGKRRALGRGLQSLLPVPQRTDGRSYFLCPIEDLKPQRAQPRKRFDETKIEELAGSIREQGVIQPLVVRRLASGTFEIIAGERRWRAAQRAGLHALPVVVQEATDSAAFELALVENLQREDLSPLEAAEGYERLLGEHGYTQDDLARRVGKDRSTIANTMRLLKLPESVRARLAQGQISEGHARALLACPDTRSIELFAARIVRESWSVRQTESAVRAAAKGAAPTPGNMAQTPASRSLSERLQRALGARVRVVDRKGKGRLEIQYASYDDLDRIVDRILR